jgi:hypothetical protein
MRCLFYRLQSAIEWNQYAFNLSPAHYRGVVQEPAKPRQLVACKIKLLLVTTCGPPAGLLYEKHNQADC